MDLNILQTAINDLISQMRESGPTLLNRMSDLRIDQVRRDEYVAMKKDNEALRIRCIQLESRIEGMLNPPKRRRRKKSPTGEDPA